jgi:hypothetical protein
MGYTFETESKSNQKEIPTNTYLPCGVIKHRYNIHTAAGVSKSKLIKLNFNLILIKYKRYLIIYQRTI